MSFSPSAAPAGGHDHVFPGDRNERNERRTRLVIALTTTMMVAEIVAGTLFGSMALVADGWHTATHAAAVLIGACISLRPQERAQPALYLRRRQDGGLAGFAGAIVLALIAVLIGWEAFCVSARRSLR